MGRLETCSALIEGGGFPIRPCYVSVGHIHDYDTSHSAVSHLP